MSTASPYSRRRMALAIAAAIVVLVAGSCRRVAPPVEETDAHEVPLGIESAVVIRCRGPRLVARPYHAGASISVRIAAEAERGPVHVYDVRYVVTKPGTFDLADYLTSCDDSPLDDLPSFKVLGQTRLTKDIETRISEIENIGVNIPHHYYHTLAGLLVMWVLWLAGLIWIGRARRPPKPVAAPPEPSLADLIARYFKRLSRADLPAEDKARLEALLLRCWRRRLRLADVRMAESCRQMEHDAGVGAAYDVLETWLHAPKATIGPAEVVERCSAVIREEDVTTKRM